MIKYFQSNPCTRCGKERVVVKVTKEYIGNSQVTNTFMSCPDPACQKVIDEKLAKEKENRDRLKVEGHGFNARNLHLGKKSEKN